MKEQDLYPPLREYLESMGLTVRSEVKSCDVLGSIDDKLIAVELKTTFSLKLVYQALDRKKITPYVFVCIPRPKASKGSSYKNMLSLLKALGIGLITIALDSPLKTLEVVLDCEKSGVLSKRRIYSVKKELEGRSDEYNIGGVNRVKLITAYREKCIELSALCYWLNEVDISDLKALGYSQKELSIFSKNYYNWFTRIKKGRYRLSEIGIKKLNSKELKPVFDHYISIVKNRSIEKNES